MAIFGLSLQSTPQVLGGCTLLVDGSLGLIWRFADANGRSDLPIPILDVPALRGVSLVAQAAALQGGSFVLSRALQLSVGD